MGSILGAIAPGRENCHLTEVVEYISAGGGLTSEIPAFLEREIFSVNPKVFIPSGETPNRCSHRTRKAISEIRGKFFITRFETDSDV